MIVRLRNLSARVPTLSDINAVNQLMQKSLNCEGDECKAVEKELRMTWESPEFRLSSDAWVIVAGKGELVGYADIRRKPATVTAKQTDLAITLCVHPEYRDRGIHTLLVRLIEDRARQIANQECIENHVTLSAIVRQQDEWLHTVFMRERYVCVRHFLRVVIGMEEAYQQHIRDGHVQFDLFFDVENNKPSTEEVKSSMHLVRRYSVFEKVLRLPGLTVQIPSSIAVL